MSAIGFLVLVYFVFIVRFYFLLLLSVCSSFVDLCLADVIVCCLAVNPCLSPFHSGYQ